MRLATNTKYSWERQRKIHKKKTEGVSPLHSTILQIHIKICHKPIVQNFRVCSVISKSKWRRRSTSTKIVLCGYLKIFPKTYFQNTFYVHWKQWSGTIPTFTRNSTKRYVRSFMFHHLEEIPLKAYYLFSDKLFASFRSFQKTHQTVTRSNTW